MSHSRPVPVSVVMPTFNRLDRLRRVLDSLAAQDMDEPFEVVVVSDGSTDGTEEFLSSPDVPLPVEPIFQANSGPAAARNAGVAAAVGELVVFLDDDVVAEPDLIRVHLDTHRRSGDHIVVIGPMLNPPDHAMSPWVAWEQAMLAKQYDDMTAGAFGATPRQFYTGNASLRREHLVAVGGFDARFRRAEDIELAFRLHEIGIRFDFQPAAKGWHYAERSYGSWQSAAYLYGRNEIVFARDRGHTWIYDFRRRSFEEHHAMIRWLVGTNLRSARLRTTVLAALSQMATRTGRSRVARYALSAVYAIEFHRGMADELGSVEKLSDVLWPAGSAARQFQS